MTEADVTHLDDPRAGLPPTAQRLLDAAWRIVLGEGFSGLTLSRISTVSGENVSAVRYYFGNKAGLVKVLLDSVIYDVVRGVDEAPATVVTRRPAAKLVQYEAELSRPGEALRIWYDLLPHAVRDEELLERVHDSYETFFKLHMEQIADALGADALGPQAPGLASLLSALSDGIAMQAIVAPEHFDMRQVLATFEVLLERGLAGLEGPAE
jgi:AcrR family transcriptional regulator